MMVAKRPRHWSYSGEKLRRWVLRRDRYECQIRGPQCTVRATQVDHIFARVAGGTEHPDNLRAACKPCNMSKGTRPDGQRFFSLSVSLERPLQNPPPPNPAIEADFSRKDET